MPEAARYTAKAMELGMALDWGVSDGLMHGAVALDLCIAPSHRFVWQSRRPECQISFGLIGRVAAGQRIV